MELIIDFMLLAASAAATFYCIVLSRKLEGLKSTEQGLGATIATMSKTVDQARSTVTLAKESSTQSIHELKPLIEETREILPQLNELIDVISELSEISINDVKQASQKALSDLQRRIDEAKIMDGKMSAQIAKFDALLDEEFDEIDTIAEANAAYVDDIPLPAPSASKRIQNALQGANVQQRTSSGMGAS